MLEQKECNPTLQKWLFKLLGLQYTVLYQKGVDNVGADALSRRFEETATEQSPAISDVTVDWRKRVMDSVSIDGKLQALIDVLKENPNMNSKYHFSQGILTRRGRQVVGADIPLQLELIKFFHTNAIGGHSRVHATYQRLASWYLLLERYASPSQKCGKIL